MFPALADQWYRQVQAQRSWKNFQADDFQRLQRDYGVTWVVLQRGGAIYNVGVPRAGAPLSERCGDSLEGRVGFGLCRQLNRLLKKPILRRFVTGHSFSRAVAVYLFLSSRAGFSPTRDLLLDFFSRL